MTKPSGGIALKESDWKLMSGRLKQSKDLCISSPKRTCWEHDKSSPRRRRLSLDALGSARGRTAHLHLRQWAFPITAWDWLCSVGIGINITCHNVQILLLVLSLPFHEQMEQHWAFTPLHLFTCTVLIICTGQHVNDRNVQQNICWN